MITKHKKEFEEMYQRVIKEKERLLDITENKEREMLLDIAKDYTSLFRKEGIGPLGIVHYLADYISKR